MGMMVVRRLFPEKQHLLSLHMGVGTFRLPLTSGLEGDKPLAVVGTRYAV
jgi:hypothetical protein